MTEGNQWVWIDGSIRPPHEAQVNVLDHGFLYGDSIYETLRSYDGHLFAADEHLERLERSAAAVRLSLRWGRKELARILDEVVAARPAGQEAGVRLVVTRGVGPLGIDPRTCPSPRLIVLGWPLSPGTFPFAISGKMVAIFSALNDYLTTPVCGFGSLRRPS